jgi:DAK2 domain fusion protein YloV
MPERMSVSDRRQGVSPLGRSLLDAEDFARAIAAGTEWLGANKELVNALNVFPVPDGDTGTNMHLTLLAAVREISKAQGKTLSDLAEAVALGSLMGARGNSGVILSQLLRGFAKGVEGKTTLDVAGLARGLQVAASMAYKAVMKPVEGTMLTVARQAARSAAECRRDNLDIVSAVEKILRDAQDTLEKTPEMLPTLKEAGVVDAGGQGLVFFWEGLVKSILGETVFTRRDTLVVVPQKADAAPAAKRVKEIAEPDLEFRYCTEFLVKGKNLPLDMLRHQPMAIRRIHKNDMKHFLLSTESRHKSSDIALDYFCARCEACSIEVSADHLDHCRRTLNKSRPPGSPAQCLNPDCTCSGK